MKNGFSLIELMITVGIIGILSLIGIPIYNDYITKVKLTELVVRHTYLANQIESELNAGGTEAAVSFLEGSCTSDLKEIKSGYSAIYRVFACTTNIGIEPNGTLYFMRVETDADELFFHVDSHIKSKSESFIQGYAYRYYYRDKNISHSHFLRYVPDGIAYVTDEYTSLNKYKNLKFSFVRNASRNLDQSESMNVLDIKMMDKNGNIHSLDDRWYCLASQLDGAQEEFWKAEPMRKSIRPSMCPYTTNGMMIIED